MTDFLKIAKSIVVHFAHICAYGVETVKGPDNSNIHYQLKRESKNVPLHVNKWNWRES